jgi:hypothetical protein
MSTSSIKASISAVYATLKAKQVSAVWVVAAGLGGLILGLVL